MKTVGIIKVFQELTDIGHLPELKRINNGDYCVEIGNFSIECVAGSKSLCVQFSHADDIWHDLGIFPNLEQVIQLIEANKKLK